MLAYDASKNWIYWTMQGYWKSMTVVPKFFEDWEATVKRANDKQQAKLMEQGCKKVA